MSIDLWKSGSARREFSRRFTVLALFVLLVSMAAPLLGARPTKEQLDRFIPSSQEIGASFEYFGALDAAALEGLKEQCVENYSQCQVYDELIPLFRKHNLVLHKYIYVSGNLETWSRSTNIDFHVVDDIDAYLRDIQIVIRLTVPGDPEKYGVRIVTIEGREFLEVYTPPHPGKISQSDTEDLALLFAAEGMLVSISQTAIECRVNADFLQRLAILVWDNVNDSMSIVSIQSPSQEGEFEAYFTMWPENPTERDEVTFTAAESDSIVEYEWYLDGEYLSIVGNAWTWKWTKPTVGVHTVRLVVEDSEGNTDEYERTFEVVEAPEWPSLFIYEQVLESGRLVLKPLKTTFTVRQPSGEELVGITDERGNASLMPYLTDSNAELIPGGYRIELSFLPTGSQEWWEKWGTYQRYPSRSKRGPLVVLDVQRGDGESKCRIRVTRAYSVWVMDEHQELVAVYPPLGPDGLGIEGDLVLVIRSLETWEKVLRAEIEEFLIAAGVDRTRAEGIVENLAIRYGVDCGMCGSEPCPAEFKPPSRINIRLAADEFYSFGGIDEHSLSDLIHEFGHKVKENLLHDPGADLGGRHESEWDPSENRDTAYDEGFANLFPVLVMSYSDVLPSYVGEHYDTGKYFGRHPGGKRGDWIEGRITGFWVAFYGLSYWGKSAKSAAALRDLLGTCRAFERMYGRYPRTIDEWILAKAFLDPTSISKIEELAKTAKYDIPVVATPDMREPSGILRSAETSGVVALVLHDSLEADLTPPSRLDASQRAVASMERGGISVLVLEPGDSFKAEGVGFDGTLFLKRTGDSSGESMLRVDLYGLGIFSGDRGLVRFLENNVLYVSKDSKVHFEKLGEGVGGLKVRTDSAEITSINSEFVLEVDSEGTTQLVVLEGEVVVAAASEEVAVRGGQMTRVEPGQPPQAPSDVDLRGVEEWWTHPSGQPAAGEETFSRFRKEVLEQSFAGKCLERGLDAAVPGQIPGSLGVALYPASLALGLALEIHRAAGYHRELGAVLALFVASALIGAVYLLVPAAAILALAKKLGKKIPGAAFLKAVLILWGASVAGIAAGEYLESPSIITPSILLFTAAAALAAALLPAIRITKSER